MHLRWIGASLILTGCTWAGLSAAASFGRQEQMLCQLQHVLSYMVCQLQYRQLPLPVLCRQASLESCGTVGRVFSDLSEALNSQVEPGASGCMQRVLRNYRLPGKRMRRIFMLLGRNLGCFDLQGQIAGLEEVAAVCERERKPLSQQKQNVMRSYRTLGVCAGAALAILFL